MGECFWNSSPKVASGFVLESYVDFVFAGSPHEVHWHQPSQVLVFLAEMFDKQQANTIFWSPQGQFVVLAGLRRWVGSLPTMATLCS